MDIDLLIQMASKEEDNPAETVNVKADEQDKLSQQDEQCLDEEEYDYLMSQEMRNTFSKTEKKYFEDGYSDIDVNLLVPYEHHTFSPLTYDEFVSLKNSIENLGLQEPLLVRHKDEKLYEILAGHNRFKACKDLGYKSITCRVGNDTLTDDVAAEITVISNLTRRQKVKITDIAKSLLMLKNSRKYSTEENFEHVEFGLTKKQIWRYIRINYLSDEFKVKVDDGTLQFISAVELSNINENMQQLIYKIAETLHKEISKKMAIELNKNKLLLTETLITDILSGTSESKKVKSTTNNISINKKAIAKYFTKGEDDKAIEKIIEAALEKYYECTIDI